MSTATETPVETFDISGSCHCGAIKFIVHNVDLTKANKCNCTICTATGRLGLRITPGDISVTNPSGNPTPIRYSNSNDTSLWPAELTFYSPAFHRGDVEKGSEPARHHFCKICSINLFIIGNIPNYGEIVGVNVLSLDLKSIGKDLKDISNPKTMRYTNGRVGTFAGQTGEPHEHGSW
ncbi:hypothetical protein ABW20_dc0109217 [Dactylellina cionopaga]|nr:hypothetical protein ABW20_dc0109217 [Dactylellina cionopaga]